MAGFGEKNSFLAEFGRPNFRENTTISLKTMFTDLHQYCFSQLLPIFVYVFCSGEKRVVAKKSYLRGDFHFFDFFNFWPEIDKNFAR